MNDKVLKLKREGQSTIGTIERIITIMSLGWRGRDRFNDRNDRKDNNDNVAWLERKGRSTIETI